MDRKYVLIPFCPLCGEIYMAGGI